MDPFEQGYNSDCLAANPHWINYPKEAPEEEKINAYRFVDGYVKKIKEENQTS